MMRRKLRHPETADGVSVISYSRGGDGSDSLSQDGYSGFTRDPKNNERSLSLPAAACLITLLFSMAPLRANRRNMVITCEGNLKIFPFDSPKCFFAIESSEYSLQKACFVSLLIPCELIRGEGNCLPSEALTHASAVSHWSLIPSFLSLALIPVLRFLLSDFSSRVLRRAQ